MLSLLTQNSFQRWAIRYAASRGVTLSTHANWVRSDTGRHIYTEQGVRAFVLGSGVEA